MRCVLSILLFFAAAVFGQLRADIDGDGEVNFYDLTILCEEWNMSDKCLEFNGSSQLITVVDSNVLDFGTDSFSISAWLKFANNNNTKEILCKFGTYGVEGGYRINIVDNKITCSLYDTGSGQIDIPLPAMDVAGIITMSDRFGYSRSISTRKWFLLTFVIDKTALKGYVYVNGNQYEANANLTTFAAVNLDNAGNLNIANSYTGSYYYAGNMDDLRFYKKALSQAEIAAIYNNGSGRKYIASSAEGGAASWASNCDDGTGDTLTDAVGGVNGSLTGNVTDNMWAAGGTPFVTNLVASRLKSRNRLAGLNISTFSRTR